MTAILSSLRHLRGNPVLRRELDVRAQSKISALAMTMWLFLLGGLASLVYWGYASNANDRGVADNARIGQELFHWTLFGMLSLVLFLVPAFTASAVAGERTRQTLIPVQMTALGPFDIVLGKTVAAIAFTVLLVIAAAPMLAVAFLVGGLTIGDLFSGVGILILTAVMLGAVGIAFSSVFRSVQAATVVTYGFVALIVIGSVVGWVAVAIAGEIDGPNPDPPPPLTLVLNPYVGLADAVAEPSPSLFFDGPANPISGIRQGIFELQRDRAGGFDGPAIGDGPVELPESTALWRWYVGFAVIVTYISLYVATNRLRTPAEVER